MLTKAFVTAAAAGLLFSSPAHAGDADKTHKMTGKAHKQTSARSPTTVNPTLSLDTSTSTSASSAQTGTSSNVSATAPMSASNAIASGGSVQVTTSTPVADTPENRALYGAPISHTGKITRAAGN